MDIRKNQNPLKAQRPKTLTTVFDGKHWWFAVLQYGPTNPAIRSLSRVFQIWTGSDQHSTRRFLKKKSSYGTKLVLYVPLYIRVIISNLFVTHFILQIPMSPKTTAELKARFYSKQTAIFAGLNVE